MTQKRKWEDLTWEEKRWGILALFLGLLMQPAFLFAHPGLCDIAINSMLDYCIVVDEGAVLPRADVPMVIVVSTESLRVTRGSTGSDQYSSARIPTFVSR